VQSLPSQRSAEHRPLAQFASLVHDSPSAAAALLHATITPASASATATDLDDPGARMADTLATHGPPRCLARRFTRDA
jgi:hypothetical protein